jgi:ubiquitin-like 1-activating enzyme E1 A
MAKETAAPRELTGEEAAVYDRQIRLWGLDAQRRLAASAVLITGAANCMLAQELAKNLVLSGIASLTLAPAAADTPGAGGFLGADLPAAAAALTDINPLVAVSVANSPVDVAGFSLVCAVDADEAHERETAAACRATGVPFQCGRAPGPVGFFFLDLGKQYVYTVQKAAAAEGSAAAAVAEQAEVKESEKVLEYVGYAEAVDGPWGGEPKRTDCGWHVAGCLRAFEREFGRLPGGREGDGEAEADVAAMARIYAALRVEKKADRGNETLVEDLARTACYVLPPVAAVVGGMWGREAIKVVSRRDMPIDNFFFYSARSSQGTLEKIWGGVRK